ncbi:MAG: cytosine permease [Candidatus Acidiferrales bacterium]
MNRQSAPKLELLADDFALERVPAADRKPMRDILWIELGIVTAMSEFVVASALGYGMTFWQAFVATCIGTALLLVVSVLIGVAGASEGLPSGLLSRWSGFGRYGSCLISLVIVIGCTAWFGVQNSICAEAISRSTHGRISFPVASALTGLLLIVIATLGIHWVSKTASVVVPVFLALVAYGTYRLLASTSLNEIVHTPAPGPHLGVFTGASMVAGGLMIGAVVAPDFTRYCRKGSDVFWAMLISLLVGEFGLGLASVLLSHAARTNDVISIIFGVAGWLGVAVVVLATLKLNDVNLYSSSLHLANLIQVVFRYRVNRGILTVALGIVGILFSILGILDHIVGFLLILGVTVPPIGGIIIADYFLLRRDRNALAATRSSLRLPVSCEAVNPVALAAWLGGFLAGYYIHWGIAALNSIVVAGALYFAVMRILAVWARQPIKYFPAAPTVTSQP